MRLLHHLEFASKHYISVYMNGCQVLQIHIVLRGRPPPLMIVCCSDDEVTVFDWSTPKAHKVFLHQVLCSLTLEDVERNTFFIICFNGYSKVISRFNQVLHAIFILFIYPGVVIFLVFSFKYCLYVLDIQGLYLQNLPILHI